MMDLMKSLQDPEFVEQMTKGPAILAEKLTNIENQLAEILQICKSAPWYSEPTHTDTGTTDVAIVGEDSPTLL